MKFLAKMIIKQLVETVGWLHERNVYHGDIDPLNILVDSNYKIKLVNLHSAANFGKLEQNEIYTHMAFMPSLSSPPEVISRKAIHGVPQDIWAMGTILYIMVYGQLPFKSFNDIKAGLAFVDAQTNPGKEALVVVLESH